MVLAPLDLNMSAKELQNLNSSRYAATAIQASLFFSLKRAENIANLALWPGSNLALVHPLDSMGTWGPLARNVSWISRICLIYSWYITLSNFPYRQPLLAKLSLHNLTNDFTKYSISWVRWLTVWVSETIEWNIGWDDRQFWNDGTVFGVASGYVLLKKLLKIWNSTASVASSLTSRSKLLDLVTAFCYWNLWSFITIVEPLNIQTTGKLSCDIDTSLTICCTKLQKLKTYQHTSKPCGSSWSTQSCVFKTPRKNR